MSAELPAISLGSLADGGWLILSDLLLFINRSGGTLIDISILNDSSWGIRRCWDLILYWWIRTFVRKTSNFSVPHNCVTWGPSICVFQDNERCES